MSDLPPGPPAGAGLSPQRRRSSLLRVLGTAAAAVFVVLLGNQAVDFFQIDSDTNPAGNTGSPVAEPGAATTSASPKATAGPRAAGSGPAATPRPKASPKDPNRTLKNNSLYDINLHGTRVTCGIAVHSPRPPLRNSTLTPYTTSLMKCMVKVFRKPLAAKGFKLTEPKVKVYRTSIKSPCGRFDQRGAPAYYCSANQTIYWPATRDDGREAYTFARLGYIALAAHEFGHHLQAVTGMVNEYGQKYEDAGSRKERDRLSRRLELQAQCFEGVFLQTVARSIRLNAADREELRMWHNYTGDEDPPSGRRPDHGSSAAQIRWLDRGLDSQDFGRCDTWSVRTSAVK